MIYLNFNQKIVAANWKMNKDIPESVLFAKNLKKHMKNEFSANVIIFPSFVSIYPIAQEFDKTGVKIGAQNCSYESSGAFTGEVSMDMLKSAGAEFVLAGHSERRNLFFESNEVINKKVLKILQSGLKVIVCVGESLEERESGITKNVILEQLSAALSGVKSSDIKNISVAYEPMWAIGTGKVVSSADACCVANLIKNFTKKEFKTGIPVLYGGSVKSSNAEDFLSMPEIDGVLVGGAALDETEFLKIINIAERFSK